MAVLPQAEDEGQHIHEKAAETWRNTPDPITQFGSRDCCWLTLYVLCTAAAQELHISSRSLPQFTLSTRPSIYPYIFPIKFC